MSVLLLYNLIYVQIYAYRYLQQLEKYDNTMIWGMSKVLNL